MRIEGATQCTRTAADAAKTAPWKANEPSWLNKSSCEPMFPPPRQSLFEEGGHHASQLGEDTYAFRNFFHGLVAGSYLEIGGLDGKFLSHSLWFHHHMAWRGMLVEGNPKNYAALAKNRPHDITVNAAICGERTTVHYIEPSKAEESGVSGIIEFMSEEFKRAWYPKMDAIPKIEVPCVPLSDVLDYYNIKHVDFFTLDVEGAELSLLKSIDFKSFTFDVIVVELDGRDKEKDEGVRSLLTAAGYAQQARDFQNTWFVRKGFSPSVDPTLTNPARAG